MVAESQLRERPGDQPLPVPNDGPSMHDLVCKDVEGWPAPRPEIEAIRTLMIERKRLGLQRYGSLLQAGNGRSWQRDLREELADAAVYARTGLEELDRDAPGELIDVYDDILAALFRLHKITGAPS
jgi:hypothetical protein